MKKPATIVTACALLVALSGTQVSAQVMDLVEKKEVYEKEHIPMKDPIPYPFVREADVTWEKTIWRTVNLREKMNLPLYFPTEQIGDRRNLVGLMLDVLENPEPEHPVYAYATSINSNAYEFERPMSFQEVLETKIKPDTITEPVRDSITGEVVQRVTGVDIRLEEISRLLVKEKWFFDKRYSALKVRIIGLCPVKVTPTTIEDPNTGELMLTGDITQEMMFWIYYPDLRYYLSRNFVFNPDNDAQPISFDDLFMQRRFSSYIHKESNVYDNRSVRDYAGAYDAMFEAERIKREIFNWEQDLWEY